MPHNKWIIAFRQQVPNWDGSTYVNQVQCDYWNITDGGKTVIAVVNHTSGPQEMYLNRNNILSIVQIDQA